MGGVLVVGWCVCGLLCLYWYCYYRVLHAFATLRFFGLGRFRCVCLWGVSAWSFRGEFPFGVVVGSFRLESSWGVSVAVVCVGVVGGVLVGVVVGCWCVCVCGGVVVWCVGSELWLWGCVFVGVCVCLCMCVG